MLTILDQDIHNKRSNFLKLDHSKNFVDKNQIIEHQKRLWFKGSRYR